MEEGGGGVVGGDKIQVLHLERVCGGWSQLTYPVDIMCNCPSA